MQPVVEIEAFNLYQLHAYLMDLVTSRLRYQRDYLRDRIGAHGRCASFPVCVSGVACDLDCD